MLANLTHLLQLALDLDAGRYSSIQSFLDALQKPGVNSGICASARLNQSTQDAIQIMTIHAAKGLEAPVVFLIDTGSPPPKQRPYQTVINWPMNANRPDQFFIVGRKQGIDEKTQLARNQHLQTDWKEELNLLYVALTRAKQYLFVSGVQTKHGNNRNYWYSTIEQALADTQKDDNGAWLFEHAAAPAIAPQPHQKTVEKSSSAIDLSKPFAAAKKQDAHAGIMAVDDKLAGHGTLVHKLFELLSPDDIQHAEKYHHKIEVSLSCEISLEKYSVAIQEVKRCFAAPRLKEIFAVKPNQEILSEAPVCYIENEEVIYGMIDHLIVAEDFAWIVDFKTAPKVTRETMSQQAMQYQEQISNYYTAVKKLYPDKEIRASILFTALPEVYHYRIDSSLT